MENKVMQFDETVEVITAIPWWRSNSTVWGFTASNLLWYKPSSKGTHKAHLAHETASCLEFAALLFTDKFLPSPSSAALSGARVYVVSISL